MHRFDIEEPSAADIELLEDRLYDFNARTTGIDDGRSLGVFLRDESGSIVAGLLAIRGERPASCVRSGWQHPSAARVLVVDCLLTPKRKHCVAAADNSS